MRQKLKEIFHEHAGPDNVFLHCYGCHQYLGSRPSEFREWVIDKIGEGRYELLQQRAADTSIGRLMRKEQKEAAKHYREQTKEIEAMRRNGNMRIIEVLNYA